MKKILSSFLIVCFMLVGQAAIAHDRTIVNGLTVIFGGEPEPMLDNERQYLAWRFSDDKNKEVITDIETVEVAITFGDKDYGKFSARASRRTPEIFKTAHIFTKPGKGKATMTFKRKGSDETHSVSFPFEVHSRKDMEIGG